MFSDIILTINLVILASVLIGFIYVWFKYGKLIKGLFKSAKSKLPENFKQQLIPGVGDFKQIIDMLEKIEERNKKRKK